MLNWNEISGIWRRTHYLHALVCDPYHFIGHQQHRFNEGGYLFCDNVLLGFYQCNMKAEWASTMQVSIIFASARLLSCFSGVSPPYQKDDTTTEFHEEKQQFQQYLCTWSLGAHTAEKLYSRKLEKSFWWPWKFKCAWFNSAACLLRFFITLIKCLCLDSASSSCTPLCALKSSSEMFFPSSDNKWCTESCKNVWLPHSNHIWGDLWI